MDEFVGVFASREDFNILFKDQLCWFLERSYHGKQGTEGKKQGKEEEKEREAKTAQEVIHL